MTEIPDIASYNWALQEPTILTVISDDTVLVARKLSAGAFVIIVDDTTGEIWVNGVVRPDISGEFVDVAVHAIAARGLMGPLNQTLGRPIEYNYARDTDRYNYEYGDYRTTEEADAAQDQRDVYRDGDDLFPPE
jgi:hypothetical protein